ncbi:MAG TPA: outer membrane protein transport protein [Novimethylophilus sp.]|jgi:long-chain fatty acid transport protein|uniref:OmpP1/FadL family transporter n=1 Tax=Novimethylophilus sp. TaxID=2137426 RepID=UPI002F408433
MKKCNDHDLLAATLATTLVLAANNANALNLGSDFNLTATPAGGGMAGVGYARPQDPVSAVFGNPATMTQLEGDTAFSLGMSYLGVDARAKHDGSVTGAPFSADSDASDYVLPTVGAEQRLTDKAVIGGGIQMISGLGADFRAATALRPQVELIVFGANVGGAYQMTPQLSVGASATVAFGLLELGLLSNTALKHDFGVRGTVGATYDAGPAIVSLTYNSPLSLSFRKVTETAPGQLSTFDLQQPQEGIIGIASSPRLWPNLLLEADFIYKNWGNADGYKDVWKDQGILALGAQYTMGQWVGRLGYSYASDLQKSNVGNSVGNFNSLSFGGGAVPISPTLVKFVQATLVQPYWQQQIAAGVGYKFNQKARVDLQGAYAFDGDRRIGGTKVEVNEFQVGAAFTWNF